MLKERDLNNNTKKNPWVSINLFDYENHMKLAGYISLDFCYPPSGICEKKDFAWAVQTASVKKKMDCSSAEFLELTEGFHPRREKMTKQIRS